jgi:hypothetical protein
VLILGKNRATLLITGIDLAASPHVVPCARMRSRYSKECNDAFFILFALLMAALSPATIAQERTLSGQTSREHGMRHVPSRPRAAEDIANHAVRNHRKDGAAGAVARYRELRRDEMVSSKYSFYEWEINELAHRLTEAGNTAGAILILEMNDEFYPKSADIDFTLGELHRGRREQAIARDKAALEKAPQHEGAKRWLAELTKP